MNRARSLSASKSLKSKSIQLPHHIHSAAVRTRKSKLKIGEHPTDWVKILQDIGKVTEKVKKLYKQESRVQQPRTKSQLRLCLKNISSNEKQMQNFFSTEITNQDANYCNSNCHNLMEECIMLRKENQRLISQKENLEKRLYFQSKEKRELRWKLQRQKEIELQRLNRANHYNNSFTLRIEKSLETDSKSQQMGKLQGSEKSYSTAKKTRGLKQIPINLIRSKDKMFKSKDDDSLLIDFSNVEDENYKQINNNNNEGKQNFLRLITLEKSLHDLLEISKHETDLEKKKVLRKKMKKLASELQSLKSQ